MIDARERERLVATVLAGFRADSPRRMRETLATLGLTPAYETELAFRLRENRGRPYKGGDDLRDSTLFALRARLIERAGLSPELIEASVAQGITRAEHRSAGFGSEHARFPNDLRGDEALRQAWGLVLRDVVCAPSLGAATTLALDAGLTIERRGSTRVNRAVDLPPAAVGADGARRWTF